MRCPVDKLFRLGSLASFASLELSYARLEQFLLHPVANLSAHLHELVFAFGSGHLTVSSSLSAPLAHHLRRGGDARA